MVPPQWVDAANPYVTLVQSTELHTATYNILPATYKMVVAARSELFMSSFQPHMTDMSAPPVIVSGTRYTQDTT